MFGVGIQELVILLVILGIGVVGISIVYFVVRAATKAGVRDAQDKH